METVRFVFFFSFVLRCCCYSNKLLLISMDGFRWDYMDTVDTPNMDRMAREGVRASGGLINTFATKSIPCHYTMVTGLYEESHGIVGNRMYDPVFNETFTYNTTDSKWFKDGEPIWITARLQGLKTGAYFWSGSESELRGTRPNFWKKYDRGFPFLPRVDTVVDWLKDDVIFACLYFHEPDGTGHMFGPSSQEVKDKVKEMDDIIGYLFQKLHTYDLLDRVNIILTSDHGMADMDIENRVIDLLDYVDGRLFEAVDIGAFGNIRPVAGSTEEVYEALKGKHPNMTVYLKQDLPARYHYRNNRRVMDIFIEADEGWTLAKDRASLAKLKGVKGIHGYDNELVSMRPFFLARGPNFKQNYTVKPFKTVSLYPLMCRLLGIEPAPNNGSLENVKAIITGISGGSWKPRTSHIFPMYILVLLLVW